MPNENYTKIIQNFCNQRILVVGDIMLDEYIWGKTDRISPEAPVPVVQVISRSYVPGGAANVAANIANLNAQVQLGGVIGTDERAETLCQILRERGVDTSGIVSDDQRPTTTKSRIIAHNQQIARLDVEYCSSLGKEKEAHLLMWIEDQLENTDVCVLSDYGKGLVSESFSESLISLLLRFKKPVVVDPKGKNYKKYRGATIITPNVNEAKYALNYSVDEAVNLLEVGQQLSRLLNGSALLLTQGADGMSLFVDGLQKLHIPAVAASVFDVTGAGDTVVSVLALAIAAGASLEVSAHLANEAAGIVVSKLGTATLSLDELVARI